MQAFNVCTLVGECNWILASELSFQSFALKLQELFSQYVLSNREELSHHWGLVRFKRECGEPRSDVHFFFLLFVMIDCDKHDILARHRLHMKNSSASLAILDPDNLNVHFHLFLIILFLFFFLTVQLYKTLSSYNSINAFTATKYTSFLLFLFSFFFPKLRLLQQGSNSTNQINRIALIRVRLKI